MKTLALRAVALIALGLFAHTVKPFTTENITAYALSSARSLAAWMPDTALARWERTAVLAAVIGQAWTDYAENDRASWRPVLASNLQPAKSALAAFNYESNEASQCALSKNKPRRPVAKPSPLPRVQQAVTPTAAADEAAVISWQSEETVEPSTVPQEGEPVAPVTTSKAFTFQLAPLLPAAATKRAACEMPAAPATAPAATQEAEVLETAPVAEPDPVPMMIPAYPRRSGNVLEIEIQPIRYRLSPAQRRQSPNQVSQKSLTRC